MRMPLDIERWPEVNTASVLTTTLGQRPICQTALRVDTVKSDSAGMLEHASEVEMFQSGTTEHSAYGAGYPA